MKSRILFKVSILIAVFITLFNSSFANAGGEISYQWLSDSTYRVFFKYFRNCSGPAEPDSQYLCIYNSCNSVSTTVTMFKSTGTLINGNANGSNIISNCPGSPTSCQNILSTIPDYREWWYTATITISRCNFWRFATWITSRSSNNNLNGGGALYVEAAFNNLAFQGNSSPYFSIAPIPFVCNNQYFTYNNGAVDPNNDSLATEIVNPLSGNNCSTAPTNIGFNPASPSFSIPNNPIQTNNSFVLNSATGEINFTPSASGTSALAIKVKEYRNGLPVGYVMRDVQVQVLNGCTTTPPTLTVNSTTINGGNYSNNVMKGCIGQQLSFCVDIKSADTASILKASDNHLLSIPTAILSYSHLNDDSVRVCFSWTPSAIDTGLRSVIISVKDSTCKAPGYLPNYAFTIPIFIWPAVKVFNDVSICPGTSVTLHAQGVGSFLWNTLPGGSTVSSMSCTLCPDPIVQPTLTTSYYAESLLIPYCTNRFDTATVTILPIPQFSPLKDTTTCPNTPILLDLKTTPPVGSTYKYQWSPATALSNDTISNPIANPQTTTTYTIIINVVGSPCFSYDTVNVKVLKGFQIVTPDTAICLEQSLNLVAVGDTSYKYLWSTTSGANIIPNNTLTTFVNPFVLGNFTYILKGTYPGCIDSIDSVHIDVQPYPDVLAGNDIRICTGASVQIKGSVTPATYPYLVKWNPIIGLNNPGIADPVFTANTIGTDTFTLYASSTAGCTDSDKVVITVFSSELLTITSKDTSICSGDSIQLHISGNGLKTFSWFPNFNISDPRSYDPYVKPVGTRTYIARAADEHSCTDTESITITVKPAAVIYLPDSVVLYPGDYYHLEPQGNCLYFNWLPERGLNNNKISNPITKPDSNTRYVVTGKTEFGCSTKDSIDIILSPDSYIDVPNAFVPNSDRNFIFKPVHLGKVSLKSFSVYNRWGTKVFQTADINEGWDGKFNGELQPMGVYVYTIEATTFSGKKFTMCGNVTLIR